MQIINQIGHLQHWGLSPATNVLSQWKKKQSTIRILLSGCSDIRHILKTLCDINRTKLPIQKIQIYFHQTHIQLLCRMMLLIHIIHETHLNYQQRTQLFLDLFANAMIKQRNAKYLHLLKQDLLNFIHDQNKVITPLKKIINLKMLRFQQRDQMSQFVSTWSMKIDFDMEKMRDQKLRYLFKQRYDYRNNLIDWDYSMNLIPVAPISHFYHYREWRLTGLAYEQRFSSYCQPNRTLGSYAQGKKKDTRTSCIVRGYWGDIVVSPYISLGVRCDYPQQELLFKKANYKYIGHSVELSIYNMMYWLHRLEQDKQYVKVFRDYYRTDEKTKKQLEEKDQQKKKKKKPQNDKDLKEIKQEEQQVKEEQEQIKQQTQQKKIKQQEQQRKQKQQIKQQTKDDKQFKPKLKAKKVNEEGLDSDQQRQKQQVQKKNAIQLQLSSNQVPVLRGFSNYQLQIFPLNHSSQNLFKPKLHNFFDVIVLGFSHSAYLKPQRNVVKLLKDQGQLIVQRATFLVPLKKEERTNLDQKLLYMAKQYKQLKKINQTDENYVFQKKSAS